MERRDIRGGVYILGDIGGSPHRAVIGSNAGKPPHKHGANIIDR